MGIKDLWSILTPFYERKPLFELQGKTVAIDLSCWVCESQCITEYSIQPRMYLRNLYFRTCYLLLMEVNPVFVLEGKAPTLKYDTIAQRNAIQFKGARPRKNNSEDDPDKPKPKKAGKDRSRFNFILKQCEQMLAYMGLACIKGEGEAEALCAYLNEDNLVDGCISQDSDCFAYGAQVVYRNFSISTQGTAAASGGAVDVYDLRNASSELGIGRNKIIALALLLGCDYYDGVSGVGKESAMKFLSKYSDDEVLDRFRLWKTHDPQFKEMQDRISGKNDCTNCGHAGNVRNHNKLGCSVCGTASGCDGSVFKEEKTAIKNELSIRSKIIDDPDFPNQSLINEFLVRKENVSKLDLRWKQPNLKKFVIFTEKYLDWPQLYCFQKFLPIVTRWQLRNFKKYGSLKGYYLAPLRIKKIRNPKGCPSYEIIWKDAESRFDDLIPEDQLAEVEDKEKLWSTIEPQDLVQLAYPDLVQAFLDSKVKPKKATKRKPKIGDAAAAAPKPKGRRKKKEDVPKIDDFLAKNIPIVTEETQKIAKTKIIDVSLSKIHELDCSNFGDESDLDVSQIIENITRKPIAPVSPSILNTCVSETSSPVAKPSALNVSSFFDFVQDDVDIFEKTINDMQAESTQSSNDDDTVEYEYSSKDNNKDKQEASEGISKENDEDEDSFSISYVPLAQRIKAKLL